jgi:DNA-directed RNA polymerase subunit RPC12/RpoP
MIYVDVREKKADAWPQPTDMKGLVCSRCGCPHLCVMNTRPQPDGLIKRYRMCRYCGHRIVTHEKIGEVER